MSLLRAPPRLVRAFYVWSFARGFCARGWWLVTSVYLVVVAQLSPSQLVLLGTGQALVVLVAEVPAGVFADVVSRKWCVVIAQVVSGCGMVLTGTTTSFPVLVLSQACWGLGWAFASGADVAWITDELDRADLIDGVLAARARWELIGAAGGLVAAGAIAAETSVASAVIGLGTAFALLGGVVAATFPETRFVPAAPARRWRAGWAKLRGALGFARRDAQVASVIVAWLLVNGAGEGYGRLVERRLVDVGFGRGDDVIVPFTVLGLATLLLSAAVLRAAQAHLSKASVARSLYAACCAAGAAGMLTFALAPDGRYAVAAVLVTSGVAHPGAVVRALGEIWVNGRTSGEVRATVHSFLSQAEHAGELVLGLGFAALAGQVSATVSVTAAAAVLVLAAAIVRRAGTG